MSAERLVGWLQAERDRPLSFKRAAYQLGVPSAEAKVLLSDLVKARGEELGLCATYLLTGKQVCARPARSTQPAPVRRRLEVLSRIWETLGRGVSRCIPDAQAPTSELCGRNSVPAPRGQREPGG